MSKVYVVPAIMAAILVAGCSSMGRLTVKDYQAKSGERVMAGQAEPKDDYQCTQVAREGADRNWGLKVFNQAQAIERITAEAVDAAPGKKANYAYVILPSEFGMGGWNFNAFRDVYVAYYQCSSLPAAQS